MKKIVVLLLLSFSLIFNSLAQEDLKSGKSYDKNVLKVNLTGLLINNYGFQYERMLGRKTSFALGYRNQPNGALPLQEFSEKLIDDPETFADLQKINYGNTAFTPEIRFYLGKQDGPRGFYIAPYARYSNSKVTVKNFEFTFEETLNGSTFEETRTVELNGDITGITGGLMIGAQWRLGRSVYLDWWIIGGSFGTSNGLINALTKLDKEEQDGLREELENLEIPILDYTISVDGNGAKLNFNGPFASLRGGLLIGFKF